ncbi:DUF4238 domain-containing protein [Butyrivibrio sp. XPD2006]|uniref:DUF4238 domain-containing protein n=1 Tax=Butyrivibrio sp. XPD2006 TaxID=1280668 RepID=UPI0012DEB07D|nr:DUF4238 domain-containing protein [Butyrivibrio sp. XPD2006]
MKKREHYVPRMVLKNFCIEDEPGKCWEYNLHNKSFSKKRIEELCAQNYLYEIRDDKGDFFYDKGKNAVENGFGQLESEFTPFLDTLINRLEYENTLTISNNDLELLYTWISFLLIRNPIIFHALPFAAKEIGINIENKLSKSYSFIEVMPYLLERFTNDLKNGHIEFYKAVNEFNFVMSDIPIIIKEFPLHHYCYYPLSSRFAMAIKKPVTVVTDIHKCNVKMLNNYEVMKRNYMMFDALMNSYESDLAFGNSLIANNEIVLRQMILPGV